MTRPPLHGIPLLTDVADLVLGRCCLGCGAPGPSLCEGCLGPLRRRPVVLPGIGRLPTVVSCARYDGLVQRSIIAYKEHANRSLAGPLGLMLADAVREVARLNGVDGVTLVPIPGHRRGGRGFDALGGIVRQSAGALDAAGIRAPVRRLLRSASDYATLKGLGRDERFDRIAGAFQAAPLGRAHGRQLDGPIVIVDDVVTTGATVTEAVRVLLGAGRPVLGIATVAATPAGQRRLH